MITLRSHPSRFVLFSGVALALIAGLVSAAPPADAQPRRAIESFDVEPADDFPAEALLGERTALATDELLLSDGSTDLDVRRVTNEGFTQLNPDVRGDPPASGSLLRARNTPGAATAAGRLTAPFSERTLTLANVDGTNANGEWRGLLQLTSRSDGAEFNDGFTSVADPSTEPVAGRTYVLRTEQDDYVGSNPGALGLASFDDDPNIAGPGVGVAQFTGATTRSIEWTVLALVGSDEQSEYFQLVSREDGLCLSDPMDGAAASAYPATVICDHDDPMQHWESRVSAAGGVARDIVNRGSRASLMLPDDPSGPVGFGFDPDPGWLWQEVEQPSRIPASAALDVEARIDLPFDLAVADLDGVRADDGLPRDEAVVVDGSNTTLNLTVVDYNGNASGLRMTSEATGIALGTTSSGGRTPIAVDTADLDGDGTTEIVVTYVGEGLGVSSVVARYTADGAHRSLVLVGDPIPLGFSVPGGDYYSADAAVFDFNGDGADEVAWVGADPANGNVPTLRTVALQLTGSLLSVQPGTITPLSTTSRPVDNEALNQQVRVAGGQFQSPAPDSGPRQVAATWQDATGAYVDAFAISRGSAQAASIFPAPVSTPQSFRSPGVSLAVGGFASGGGGDSTQWGLAVSAVPDGDTTGDGNAVTLVQPRSDGTAPAVNTQAVQLANGTPIDRVGFELTAYDRAGQSLILGEPVVFTVQELTKLNLVAGQPPSHSDWLDGEFANISRNQDFGLQMGSTQSKAYDNSTSQESNQSYGLTAEASVSDTVSEGVPLFEKGSVSVELAGKLGASFESLGTALSGRNQSQTTSLTQLTQDDDIVNAMVQDYQVTRYPVQSVDSWNRTDAATSGCESGCYGYWDVVVPGTPHPVYGPGKSFAFFDPAWQNGNALSYPPLINGEVPLPNLGPVTYTDQNGSTKTVSQALINQELGLGSVQADQTLNLTDTQSAGKAEQSTQGWTASADIGAGVKGKVKIPLVASDELEGKLAAGFNAGASFVDSNTGSTANSHDSTFDIRLPAVDANRGYNFGTAYYYGTDGAPQVNYGVDLTANEQAREWWLTNYGGAPDPALNLPYNSLLTYDYRGYLGEVEWNSLASRQQIRGFTARMPAGDDPTTSKAPYAGAPTIGDPVVFDVEVANYSLMGLTQPLTVDFYAVPVDTNSIKVVGDPISIGRQTVSELAPQARTTVSSPQWQAAGTSTGQAQNWRIFVVLDQGNSVEEIHEWAGDASDTCPSSSVQGGDSLTDPLTGEPETLSCGQNNQGYGSISVMPADTSTQDLVASNRVALHGAGVLTKDPATLQLTANSEVPQVVARKTTTVLVRADAERASTAPRTVIVYDGPPENGKVVAVTRLLGVSDDGTSTAAFRYTPQDDGIHELNAVLLGGSDSGEGQGLTIRLHAVSQPDNEVPAPDTAFGDDTPAPGTDGSKEDAQAPVAQPAPSTSTPPAPGRLAATGANDRLLLLLAIGGTLFVGVGLTLRRSGSRRSRSRAG